MRAPNLNATLKRTVSLSLVIAPMIAMATPSLAQDPFAQGASNEPSPALGSTKPLGLTQNAWNVVLRQRGESTSRPGYVRYIYDPQQSFPIRAREGMITTIKVPDDENIMQAFVGDEAGFQVGVATPQSVVIKALFPGVDTNLIMYAESGKIYTFYLRSEPYNASQITDFLVDVVSPGAGAYNGSQMDTQSPERMAQLDAENPSATARRVRDPYATQLVSTNPRFREYAEWTDFNPSTVREDLGVYVPQGQTGGIIPYRVFRDDRFTYIDYGPNASQMTEWPTPLIVIQGVEGPVGSRTAGPGGRMIVIEALGDFVLRNGQRVLVVKPRYTRTDPTLIEYPTFDPSPMVVPTELPPGQIDPTRNRPLTVKPVVTAPAGRNGEPPSQIVPLPDPRAEANIATPVARTGMAGAQVNVTTASAVEVIPVAKGEGAPIKNTLETTTVTTTAPSVPVAAVPTAPVAIVLPEPDQNVGLSSPYRVVLGKGSKAQLEDKWKSLRVQYYDLLVSKKPIYFQEGSGPLELRIEPVASAAEGMRICTALASEPDCDVQSSIN